MLREIRSFRLRRPRFLDQPMQAVVAKTAGAVNRDESLRIIDDGTFERARTQFAANRVNRPRETKEVRPFTRISSAAAAAMSSMPARAATPKESTATTHAVIGTCTGRRAATTGHRCAKTSSLIASGRR